jgi:fatty acid desaturase
MPDGPGPAGILINSQMAFDRCLNGTKAKSDKSCGTGMMRLRDDPRIRSVKWQDLTRLTTGQVVYELCISIPWLIGSIASFAAGWPAVGLAAAFFFFLTGLRQAHGAQHYFLGIGRRAQDVVLAVLSVLMVASLHALQATHMHHHRHALEPSDVEGATARMPWWKALVLGPWFIVMLHWRGIQLAGRRQRRWIGAESVAILCWVAGLSLWGPAALRWFAGAMILGECLTGFFAVWTVHHDCDAHLQLARTQRGGWKNLISYEMFYHLEHHLFPAVPTPRLPELAARLDEAVPHLSEEQVF